MKSFRADVVIATLALLLSAGATLSSLYQTKVIANQLSSSVWPYLSIESTRSPTSYTLAVTNDGLGPALIRSATLLVDGKPVANYRAALKSFITARVLARVKQHGTFNSTFGSIGPTSVYRPGDRHQLVNITTPAMAEIGDPAQRVKVEVCYCSILDQCWDDRDEDNRPREQVASCPDRKEIAF